jgi:hypothetical protein
VKSGRSSARRGCRPARSFRLHHDDEVGRADGGCPVRDQRVIDPSEAARRPAPMIRVSPYSFAASRLAAGSSRTYSSGLRGVAEGPTRSPTLPSEAAPPNRRLQFARNSAGMACFGGGPRPACLASPAGGEKWATSRPARGGAQPARGPKLGSCMHGGARIRYGAQVVPRRSYLEPTCTSPRLLDGAIPSTSKRKA